jgi:hypothetical protein
MKNTFKLLTISAVTIYAVAGNFALAHAGPTAACSTNQMCLMANDIRSGGAWEYEFATNDSDLSNNRYVQECSFTICGYAVNDNNIKVRDRKSTTNRACVYRDYNGSGGSVGSAPYLNANWVVLNPIDQGSSIYFTSNAYC